MTPTAVLLVVVFLPMLLELRLSRSNERALRASGAAEPSGDVYRIMAWAYPASFLAMIAEGAAAGQPPAIAVALGIAVFVTAKAIKYWAIASLGTRWTFRVLVRPQVPLITTGPYAWLRHPNYVGVAGELVGVALITGAAVSGLTGVAVNAWLLRRRIAVEDRALGRDQATSRSV